jgi:hypothetical protein
LQFRCPSPNNPLEYAVAFASDPGLTLEIESSLWRKDNEMLKDVLNNLIGRRLKNLFLDIFVLPNYRFASSLFSYHIFMLSLLAFGYGN